MQRRIVFAALGFPLALIAGVVEYVFIVMVFSPSVDSWMFPIVVCVCWTIDMLLFPTIGYAWGKRRDRAARADMPARYAYSILGFPLALLTGVSAFILFATVLKSRTPGPDTSARVATAFLITLVTLLVFPLIGYVWGRRK